MSENIRPQTLCIFTISFPLGKSEMFLYPEINHLSKQFSAIYLFPMESLENESRYALPPNVKVVRFNLFQPYNRIRTTLANLGLITTIYCVEFLHSKNRFGYIRSFGSTLNNLTHKISIAGKLEEELKKIGEKPPVAYTYWFNQWTFVLSLMRQKNKSPEIYTRVHGMDVYEEQHTDPKFFFQFRTFQLKHIKKVLAISNNGRQHMLANNKMPEEKIGLSRLGVNDNGLNPQADKDFIRIVSCSYLQAYKRVHLIIEILKLVKAPVEWVHFGDGEVKNEILEKSKELPSNIAFKFMGHQSNDAINEYYRHNHVDLFINVSSTEGIPVSIMEAISFGINTIGTDVGGVSEIVNDATGYLVEKDFSPAKVAGIIESYIQLSPQEKETRRFKARHFWGENYNAEKNFEKLAQTLLR